MRTLIRAFIVSGLALLGWIATAEAQPTDPYGKPKGQGAIGELKQGNRFYKLGNFKRAIDFYKSGATREAAPVFYFNLGQCYRQLGNYKKAIWFLERWKSARALPPEHQLVVVVDGLIKKMKDELAQKARTQEPTEPGPKEDASDVRFGKGPYKIDGRSSKRAKPWHADRLGWGLSGGGLVIGAVGLGFMFSASGLRSDADDEIDALKRQELRDQVDSRGLWGTVLGVAGGAALIVGIVKLARTGNNKKSNSLAVGVSPRALWLQGRF